jgi:hypothetical protein
VVSGIIEESVGFQEGWNTLVAIAAHITADARLKLWDLILLAGRENVFYCDTDSVFTNDRGFARAKSEIVAGKLGKLDLKGSSNLLLIRGAKDYVFGNTTVIKGIRADAKKISENEYEQTQFEGFAGALRKGRLDKMMLGTVRKSLHREYKKGIITKTGHVKPFTLS